MIGDQKVVVVMPAYNAAATIAQTVAELPREAVDHVIVVDDHSTDETARVAERLEVELVVHAENRGYGANQKTCYQLALERGADVVVMLHADYQYSPLLVPVLASMVASGHYQIALGSRILGGGALAGGMPLYKYLSNRVLTAIQNAVLGSKLSEFHTGLRAYSRASLERLPYQNNSDDFVFDNEILAQALLLGLPIGEISCPTRYFPEASSIGLTRSCRYGLGVLRVTAVGGLARAGRWRRKAS